MASPNVNAAPTDRKTKMYEVSSLDTIHSIALKFGMTTGELLRLNGLPSTYRIYSGQQLTVFDNAPPAAPDAANSAQTTGNDQSEGRPSPASTDPLRMAIDALEQSKPKRHGKHQRMPSTVDLEMSFTDVIIPSYRSVPTLVLLRQMRDKKYFGDTKNSTTGQAGMSDTLTATMSKNSLPVFGPNLQHGIPEEMRVSSRDLVKEQVRYYVDEQKNVTGELTLMPSSLIFEPALEDPVTRQMGLMNCQFQCDLKDVLDIHVIEASEFLGWWKSKNSPNATLAPGTPQSTPAASIPSVSATPHNPLVHASSTGQMPSHSGSAIDRQNAPPSAHSASSLHKRARTKSVNHGPSSSHLNTGSTNPTPSSAPVVEMLDRSPRFLQLTVLASKPSDGSQVGKVVYFLINRQSIDAFYQKLEMWAAQARPAAPAGKKPQTNILKPQLGLYEKHERERTGSVTNSPLNPTVTVTANAAPTASPSMPIQRKPESASSTPGEGRHLATSAPAPSAILAHSPSSTSSAAAAAGLASSTGELPNLNTPSALITNETVIGRLANALPTRYRFSDWTLLYSTERHGVSLMTFYNKTRRKGPTYLVIEDEAGFRFGAFISDSWEPQRGYYGTGECFLFTLYPSFNIYPWSQLNEYFIYSKEDTIALGGGSGKFALWLDKDLLRGSSAPCDTFLNSTLSYQEDFRPVIVEVWGFNDAMP